MIFRTLQNEIESRLFKGKAIIVTGPRQVGKTTLLEKLKATNKVKTLWLNCDEPDVRLLLEDVTSTRWREIVGDNQLVFTNLNL
jgi:predicted AAA+ superfamily ATPase